MFCGGVIFLGFFWVAGGFFLLVRWSSSNFQRITLCLLNRSYDSPFNSSDTHRQRIENPPKQDDRGGFRNTYRDEVKT